MPAPKGNKFAIGNPGNTKNFETPEELEEKIQEYFDVCDSNTTEVYVKSKAEIQTIANPIPYTIEGLCEVLGCTRQTLLNYENREGYEEYFDTIKKAKMKIQRNKLERGLMGTSNPAVTIFDLKNNHGYKDQVEIDLGVKEPLHLPDIYLAPMSEIKSLQRGETAG